MTGWKLSICLIGLMTVTGCGGGGQPPTRSIPEIPYPGNSTPTDSVFLTMGYPTIRNTPIDVSNSEFNANLSNTSAVNCEVDVKAQTPCKTNTDIRSWIGHASGGTKIDGIKRDQIFVFKNLIPNATYSFRIYPLDSSNVFTAKAVSVSGGKITVGDTYEFFQFPGAVAYHSATDYWEIRFVPSDETMTLSITNDKTAGNFYFHPDYFVLKGLYGSDIPGDTFVGTKLGTEDSVRSGAITSEFNLTTTMNNQSSVACKLDLNLDIPCALTDLRAWIGVSKSWNLGYSRDQVFSFDHLVPNQTYSLKIYIKGSLGVFKAKAKISNNSSIISGSEYSFSSFPNSWGYSPLSEFWDIRFTAASTKADLTITNELTSGDYVFYPDYYVLSALTQADPVYLNLGNITERKTPLSIAGTEMNSAVSGIGEVTCAIDVKNQKPCNIGIDLRAWIGHSDCCGYLGMKRDQIFNFSNLNKGATYSFRVYPFVSNAAFTAKAVAVNGGDITLGATYNFFQFPNTVGNHSITDYWEIRFVPSSEAMTIKITNDKTSGNFYFYPDRYVLKGASSSATVGDAFDGMTLGYQGPDGDFTTELNASTTMNNQDIATCSMDLNLKTSCLLSDLRAWIGTTTKASCSSCTPGFSRDQVFSLKQLVPNRTYSLKVYIKSSVGAFRVTASTGSDALISSGSTFDFSTASASGAVWEIKFLSTSTSADIKISNGKTGNEAYFFYPDYYILSAVK